MPVSHQNSQTSKEIRADRYLNVFRPLCFILTYCKVMVHFSHSFNLQPLIFVGVFSKTLIVDYVVFPMQLLQTMSSQLDILRMDFLCFQKSPHDFSLQRHGSTYKILTSTTNTWNLHFYTSMEHLKLDKSKRVCSLKQPGLFLLALNIVSRNYKAKRYYYFRTCTDILLALH